MKLGSVELHGGKLHAVMHAKAHSWHCQVIKLSIHDHCK